MQNAADDSSIISCVLNDISMIIKHDLNAIKLISIDEMLYKTT